MCWGCLLNVTPLRSQWQWCTQPGLFLACCVQRPFNGSQAALESLGKAILLDAATVCRGLGLSIPPLEKLQSNEVQLIGNTVVLELDHRSKLELCNSQLIGLDQGTRQEVGRTSSER